MENKKYNITDAELEIMKLSDCFYKFVSFTF